MPIHQVEQRSRVIEIDPGLHAMAAHAGQPDALPPLPAPTTCEHLAQRIFNELSQTSSGARSVLLGLGEERLFQTYRRSHTHQDISWQHRYVTLAQRKRAAVNNAAAPRGATVRTWFQAVQTER